METSTGFIFVNLEGSESGKPFDGMAAGEFTDMSGRKAKFDAAEFAQYVENTRAAIEATKTESGDIVGLPIDAKGHDKGDGAGYIVDVSQDGSKIRITPQWNENGLEIIGKKIRRWFSATVDLTNKVILGGTLTNWPATRDKSGKILLRPIELTTQMFVNTEQPEVIPSDNSQAINNFVKGKGKMENQNLAELANSDPKIAAELTEMVKARAKTELDAMLAAQKRTQEISELCARLTGGTEAAPRGLPVPATELSEFLNGIDDASRAKATAILSKIQAAGFVEFAETGHGKRNEGNELPDYAKPLLKQWVELGKTPESFFEVNPELGKASEYHLAEFAKKEN